MTMTKKDTIMENFHGTEVSDPYRWLEDPTSAETISWNNDMSARCHTYFDTAPYKSEDKKRLEALWNYPKHFVPEVVNGNLFFQKNDGLQNQAVLYRRSGNEDEVIIDPNQLSDDGTVAMTNYKASHEGTYIAYATSTHGSDWQEIYIREVDSKKDLSDTIQYVKFSSITWAPDDSGFFYSRFPDPETVSEEDEGKYHAVYFHKIGTPQKDDELIFDDQSDKDLMYIPLLSDDKRYLYLIVNRGTSVQNRLYIKNLQIDEGFTRLLDQEDAGYSYITNVNDVFYIYTDLNAPNGKLIAIDSANPTQEKWQVIIPEQEDVIDNITYLNGKFIVTLLHDAHHKLHIYNVDGTFLYEIDLPILGSLTGITKDKENNAFYFGMTSFLSPTTVYSYHMDTKNLSVFAESELQIDTGQFETKQVFFPSKDGTKVPMFITQHKDIVLDGENPALVTGYGGFNISLTPGFNPAALRWLEKGGIYVSVNLRGGNEYGEKWHKDGMLENKQNVFDDFISAGEWLMEQKYTRNKKLAITGGSNGGLLVAACMLQRPDLYGAVICRVPVIDMLRYHKFTIGHFWMGEFGDPDNPEHFPFMYAYSPLHNVKEGQTYPPILIATADTDDRVVPAHAKKFAATLLEKASPDSKVVLRLEQKAGHGMGKPTAKVIEEWVDFFAFLENELAD